MILAEDRSTYYFNPRLLSSGTKWEELHFDDVVTFLAGENPLGKWPPARQVQLVCPPRLVHIVLEATSILVRSAPLVGDRLLAPRANATRCSAYAIEFEQQKLVARRGTWYRATRQVEGATLDVFRRNADLSGMRDFVASVIYRLTGPLSSAPVTPEPPARITPGGRLVGMDLGTTLPLVDIDGGIRPSLTALHVLQYGVPGSGEGVEWLTGRADRWLDTLTVAAKNVIGMSDVLDAETEIDQGDQVLIAARNRASFAVREGAGWSCPAK